MPGNWFFEKALPIVSGIGVTIAVAQLSFLAPIVYSQAASIQKLTDKIETMQGDVTKLDATSEKLEKHLTESESDPSRVLAQVLGTTAVNRKLGTSVVIGGNVFVFPKDEAAESELARAGYTEKAITPTMSGYIANLPSKTIIDPAQTQRPGR